MKKLFIIIGVLAVIFVGMLIYKNTANGRNDITIGEINEIENYISKIYMWKEVTNESLPLFDNINNADDLWVWEAVKRNLEEYEVTYEQIEGQAKELFGESFQKEFPKAGTTSITYNEENDKYILAETDFDAVEDDFLLNNIEKENDNYVVDIIEYLEDYSSDDTIIIKNTNEEEIIKLSSNDTESRIKDIVKENIDKFTKKRVYLKQKEMVVEKVESID